MATTRMAIPLPLESDSPDGPAQLTSAANRIDAVGAMFDQGTLASRPAFGTRGRFYFATDQGRAGQLWYDTSTAWVAVEPSYHAVTDLSSLGFSPADGDLIEYQFTSGGRAQLWQLRYLASLATRKWVPVGGPPLVYLDAGYTVNAPSTWGAVKVAILTLPAAGRYMIEWGTGGIQINAGTNGYHYSAMMGARVSLVGSGTLVRDPASNAYTISMLGYTGTSGVWFASGPHAGVSDVTVSGPAYVDISIAASGGPTPTFQFYGMWARATPLELG